MDAPEALASTSPRNYTAVPTGAPWAEMSQLIRLRWPYGRSCHRWRLCFPHILTWLCRQPRHAILTFRTPVETVTPPKETKTRPGSDGTCPPRRSVSMVQRHDTRKGPAPAHEALGDAPWHPARARLGRSRGSAGPLLRGYEPLLRRATADRPDPPPRMLRRPTPRGYMTRHHLRRPRYRDLVALQARRRTSWRGLWLVHVAPRRTAAPRLRGRARG